MFQWFFSPIQTCSPLSISVCSLYQFLHNNFRNYEMHFSLELSLRGSFVNTAVFWESLAPVNGPMWNRLFLLITSRAYYTKTATSIFFLKRKEKKRKRFLFVSMGGRPLANAYIFFAFLPTPTASLCQRWKTMVLSIAAQRWDTLTYPLRTKAQVISDSKKH